MPFFDQTKAAKCGVRTRARVLGILEPQTQPASKTHTLHFILFCLFVMNIWIIPLAYFVSGEKNSKTAVRAIKR